MKELISSEYFSLARTALKFGLIQLGLKRGEKVLLPDFICNVVSDVISQFGLHTIFYGVTDSLAPDWDQLEKVAIASDARALFMVHYFGQPQDIDRFILFCSRNKLFLIEDNAHGYSGTYKGITLGTFGDIGISSPRKILSTPSGGVMYKSHAPIKPILFELNPFPLHTLSYLSRRFTFYFPKLKNILWCLRSLVKDWYNPRIFREVIGKEYRIDEFSCSRIRSADWVGIGKKRRAHWNAWLKFASHEGLIPVFNSVHLESCPWAMPVYVDSLEQRNRWLRWGALNGIPIFPWPSLPEEVILGHGKALSRWERMVCFPLQTPPPPLVYSFNRNFLNSA